MNIKQKIEGLESRVSEKEAEYKTYDISLEDSKAAIKKFTSLFTKIMANEYSANPDEAEIQKNNKLMKDCRKAELHSEIEMMKETLSLKLFMVHPSAKYLILPTDEQLTSPSGFSPDELVFIRPSTLIQTNRLPNHLGAGLGYLEVASLG